MHFEIALSDIIEHIKADKSIMQPWRNKSVARLEEAQAFIRMGLTTTNRTNPEGLVRGTASDCTCQPGVTDNSCPVHGLSTRLHRPDQQ